MTTNPPTDRSPSLAELEIRSELFDAMDGNLRMSKRHKLLDAYRDAVLASAPTAEQPPVDRAAVRDRIVTAIKTAPFEELRTVGYAPNGPLEITIRVEELADAILRAVPAAVSVPPPTRAADRAALRDRIADTVTPFLMNFSDEETAKINAGEVAAAVLAVLPETTNRAALHQAADIAEDVAESLRAHHEFERSTGALDVMTELRRMADEAQQQADTAAAIARVRAVADGLERDADAPGVVEIVRPALRDAARQIRAALPAVGAQQQPGTETHEDLPARLEAALTERFTELGNPFSEMRRHEQGPDGWPASHPVGPAKVAEVLRELLAVAPPAVGPGRVADEEPTTQTRERRCPQCGESLANYFTDDFVYRAGDNRPYCSGECVVAANRTVTLRKETGRG